jgi:hypothetical protein
MGHRCRHRCVVSNLVPGRGAKSECVHRRSRMSRDGDLSLAPEGRGGGWRVDVEHDVGFGIVEWNR